MPGFVYFLPSPKKSAEPADLTAAGLGHALRRADGGGGVTSLATTAGPGGQSGLLVTIDGDGVEPAFRPSAQTWRKGPGGRYSVGFNHDARPGPADLAREPVYEGQAVRLLDGHDWVVPRCLAVLPDRADTLPRVLDLADDGDTVVTRTHPRYAKLCEGAMAFWLGFSRQQEHTLSAAQQVQLAADALSVNYRLGKVEAVALLGLWGTDEFGLVLRAMIDADEIDAYYAAEAAKKNT